MTPLSLYRSYIEANRIKPDPFQAQAVLKLDALFHTLNSRQKWPQWFLRSGLCRPTKGLYLWGGVGRGKTFLMDIFYLSLPFKRKTRLHFHRFMHKIHHELTRYQGQRDPLVKIAKAFAKRSQILCFDEFHVSDIADAMILAELFKALFKYGVTVVATSNIEPNNLYRNGLARDKFLPTIKLIYQHMNVMHLEGSVDYRLQYLSQSKCYHYPLNEQVANEMKSAFMQLTLNQNSHHHAITLCDRSVQVVACADNVVWFTFDVLCESARSSEDYIELSQIYDTVILSEVKRMGPEREAAAKRFMHLIDELYERHVVLILSAECAINDLYYGQLLSEPFQRTISRLNEMQSQEYLCKPHLV